MSLSPCTLPAFQGGALPIVQKIRSSHARPVTRTRAITCLKTESLPQTEGLEDVKTADVLTGRRTALSGLAAFAVAVATQTCMPVASLGRSGLGFSAPFAPSEAKAALVGVLDPVGVYGSLEEATRVLDMSRKMLKDELPARAGPAIIRAAFHDAGTYDVTTKVGGANGSVRFEKDDPFNKGLPPGVNAIIKVHDALLASGVPITFADAVQLAGAVMVERAGGPFIPVQVGRRDATQADPSIATHLPSEKFDYKGLIANMTRSGYDLKDIVALSGAHTMGGSAFHEPAGLLECKAGCTPPAGSSRVFDNAYFKYLVADKEGHFPSDTALLQDPEFLKYTQLYAADQSAFFKDFTASYLKMGLQGVNMA